jgi:hypothetical protein
MEKDEIKLLLAEVIEQQKQLNEQIARQKVGKDGWDRLAALAPIMSAVIIACVGAYFTFSFNQQQLKVQEIQTIERFIPHLSGSEQSKRAAILAMSSMGDTKIAAKVASLFASEGTVSALHSMAATTTDQTNREEVVASLTRALETISEKYHEQNKTQQAIAASAEALSIKEKTFGTDSPSILRNLERLAELYKSTNDTAMVEDLLKRILAIQQKLYGPDSAQATNTAKQLAQIKLTGSDAKVSANIKLPSAPAPAAQDQDKFKTANFEATSLSHENHENVPAEAVPVEAVEPVKAPVHVRLIEKRKVSEQPAAAEPQ